MASRTNVLSSAVAWKHTLWALHPFTDASILDAVTTNEKPKLFAASAPLEMNVWDEDPVHHKKRLNLQSIRTRVRVGERGYRSALPVSTGKTS